jgi:hypothetical protein
VALRGFHNVVLRKNIFKVHFEVLDDQIVFFASFKAIKVKEDNIVLLIIR